LQILKLIFVERSLFIFNIENYSYYVVIEICLKEILILRICDENCKDKIMKINVNFTMQPAYIVPYEFPLKNWLWCGMSRLLYNSNDMLNEFW